MLADHEDAYGHMLLAHLRGEPAFEIVERDDGLIEPTEGPASYFAPVRDWPRHQREALRLAQGRALDIGCGAGRVALTLEKRDHDVVAIDESSGAIEVCRERGLHDAHVVPVTRVSSKLGLFDTIVMYGNNFGLVSNERRARWLLRRFASMTSPEARILADTRDPYQTNDPVHVDYHRRNHERGRMGGQARIRVRYRTHATPWFDLLMVSRKELAELCEGTGWHLARTVDSDGNGYVGVLEKA